MPNTPCLVSESAAAFSLGQHATAEDRELVHSLLGAVGFACEVKETQLDGEFTVPVPVPVPPAFLFVGRFSMDFAFFPWRPLSPLSLP